MDYPLFNLAKDKETADIVINGTIRNLWREPAFFSSTDGKDIVMGKLWVEVEVKIDENGKSWSEKIRENIGVPLAEKYEEEKVLEKIGEEIAVKIYFLLLKNEKGK
ncbi:MAG TPA: hypothetical protein ENF61_00110 [Firmicutes bacterium]|nr:hypothetical protein [Bacillota bacterium]